MLLQNGYQFLELEKPFLYLLVDPLVDHFKDVFNDLYVQKNLIQRVVMEEESSFLIGESNTWITGQIFNIDGGRSTVRKKG